MRKNQELFTYFMILSYYTEDHVFLVKVHIAAIKPTGLMIFLSLAPSLFSLPLCPKFLSKKKIVDTSPNFLI